MSSADEYYFGKQDSQYGNPGQPPLPQQERPGKPFVIWVFRVINMGLATMMAATGVLSFQQFGNVNGNQLSQAFVSIYLLLFAAIWFTFECNQIKPVDPIVFQLKRNFGFLFHPMGKSLFIFFVAFLNFGVQEDTLGLATGILCLLDGIILIVLYLKYPEWHPVEPPL